MDRLASMSVFAAVVDAGSLSAAGRKLRMPLPTVSRRVSELESHIGTRLLNRSTRKLVLTDSGAAYLAACRRILESVHEAERMAAGEYSEPRGTLVVTAPIVFGRLHIVPVVVEFLRTHPQVDVQLVLGDRTLNLLDDHIDLAVRIGELPDSRLVATRVAQVRTVVCASPAYLKERGTPRSAGDLAKHDCVTFTTLASPDTWTFGVNRSLTSVPVRSRLVVNTAEAAIDAAIAGVGITQVLSYQVQAAVRSGDLAIVLNRLQPAPIPVNLVYTAQGPLPLKLRAFLDFASARLRARLR